MIITITKSATVTYIYICNIDDVVINYFIFRIVDNVINYLNFRFPLN